LGTIKTKDIVKNIMKKVNKKESYPIENSIGIVDSKQNIIHN
jgi:hypothetical protein